MFSLPIKTFYKASVIANVGECDTSEGLKNTNEIF